MICMKKYIEAIIYMEMSALIFKYIHFIYMCVYYTHTHTHIYIQYLLKLCLKS